VADEDAAYSAVLGPTLQKLSAFVCDDKYICHYSTIQEQENNR
jgi:hypothetical protein